MKFCWFAKFAHCSKNRATFWFRYQGQYFYYIGHFSVLTKKSGISKYIYSHANNCEYVCIMLRYGIRHLLWLTWVIYVCFYLFHINYPRLGSILFSCRIWINLPDPSHVILCTWTKCTLIKFQIICRFWNQSWSLLVNVLLINFVNVLASSIKSLSLSKIV